MNLYGVHDPMLWVPLPHHFNLVKCDDSLQIKEIKLKIK